MLVTEPGVSLSMNGSVGVVNINTIYVICFGCKINGRAKETNGKKSEENKTYPALNYRSTKWLPTDRRRNDGDKKKRQRKKQEIINGTPSISIHLISLRPRPSISLTVHPSALSHRSHSFHYVYANQSPVRFLVGLRHTKIITCLIA